MSPTPCYRQANTNPGKPFDVQLTAPEPLRLNQPDWLDLHIASPQTGQYPSTFQVVHEKPAHIFIVRQDLSDFQHVHPVMMQPGWIRIPVNFKAPGSYKLFLQFTTPETGEQTLNKPFQLGTLRPPSKLLRPDDNLSKWVDGYTFRVSGLPTRRQPKGMFKVDIFKDGVPVDNIQPYLGAGAHGVIISQDTQSFIHTHPMAKPVSGLFSFTHSFHATEITQPGLL